MLTMDKAQLIIEAAVEKAKKLGQPMNIAIVDAATGKVVTDSTWPPEVAQRSSVPLTPMPLTVISRFT